MKDVKKIELEDACDGSASVTITMMDGTEHYFNGDLSQDEPTVLYEKELDINELAEAETS